MRLGTMRSTRRIHLMLAAGVAALALTAMPAWAGNGHGNANGHDNHGADASSMGGLNAAHASENALSHASPNSRVGKIAAYKEAALAAQGADQAVTDAQTAADTANQAV